VRHQRRRLFTLVFAVGCGIAGTGGALSVNLLGLDPSFPLRYLVFILIVVTVGGSGSIWERLAQRCCSGSAMSSASIICLRRVPSPFLPSPP